MAVPLSLKSRIDLFKSKYDLLNKLLDFTQFHELSDTEKTDWDSIEPFIEALNSFCRYVGIEFKINENAIESGKLVKLFAVVSLSNFTVYLLGYMIEFFEGGKTLIDYLLCGLFFAMALAPLAGIAYVKVHQKIIQNAYIHLKQIYSSGESQMTHNVVAINKFRTLAFARMKYFSDGLYMCFIFAAVVLIGLNLLYVYVIYDGETYPYPFPMHWRLFPIDTWWGYTFNMAHCIWSISIAVFGYTILGYTFFPAFLSLVVWPFDALLDNIENMDTISKEISYRGWVKCVTSLFAIIRRFVFI